MNYIVGIDEVGRGPLAGPVTVCVVLCEENLCKKLKSDRRLPPLGRDSKKLSPKVHQKYAKLLQELQCKGCPFVLTKGHPLQSLEFSIVHISNKVIDRNGISWAINLAINRGLRKCIRKIENRISRLSGSSGLGEGDFGNFKVLLDGGLRAPLEFKNQKTIIKGDEKEKIIAWASILAKVSRDSLMVKAHKKYPLYGFNVHKGYGTLKHRLAIKNYGLSQFHRKTFCKNIKMI